MLGCAMNDADEATTTLFPAQRIDEPQPGESSLGLPYTMGIWASDPFTYRGPDGMGSEKTYMIVDTQGLDNKHQVIPGLSRKVMNDAAVKIVAMLSEVASEFVYVLNDPLSGLTAGDFDHMGLALKTTRE